MIFFLQNSPIIGIGINYSRCKNYYVFLAASFHAHTCNRVLKYHIALDVYVRLCFVDLTKIVSDSLMARFYGLPKGVSEEKKADYVNNAHVFH